MNLDLGEKTILDTGFVKRLTDLPITNREKEVLKSLAKGKTNKEISKELILSPSTIRNHISNIFTKLRITNRSQATAIAIYAGLLTPESFIYEVEKVNSQA
ncbi:MAG: response regulator transcription factor [Candidatus Melainabacteria bacterium]|nr:response regulator transcription factor [Candidatus Melainabacteria bacterium]